MTLTFIVTSSFYSYEDREINVEGVFTSKEKAEDFIRKFKEEIDHIKNTRPPPGCPANGDWPMEGDESLYDTWDAWNFKRIRAEEFGGCYMVEKVLDREEFKA